MSDFKKQSLNFAFLIEKVKTFNSLTWIWKRYCL